MVLVLCLCLHEYAHHFLQPTNQPTHAAQRPNLPFLWLQQCWEQAHIPAPSRLILSRCTWASAQTVSVRLVWGARRSRSCALCTRQQLGSGRVNLVAAASASRAMNSCPAGWEPQTQRVWLAPTAVVSDCLLSGKVIYLQHCCEGYG